MANKCKICEREGSPSNLLKYCRMHNIYFHYTCVTEGECHICRMHRQIMEKVIEEDRKKYPHKY